MNGVNILEKEKERKGEEMVNVYGAIRDKTPFGIVVKNWLRSNIGTPIFLDEITREEYISIARSYLNNANDTNLNGNSIMPIGGGYAIVKSLSTIPLVIFSDKFSDKITQEGPGNYRLSEYYVIGTLEEILNE